MDPPVPQVPASTPSLSVQDGGRADGPRGRRGLWTAVAAGTVVLLGVAMIFILSGRQAAPGTALVPDVLPESATTAAGMAVGSTTSAQLPTAVPATTVVVTAAPSTVTATGGLGTVTRTVESTVVTTLTTSTEPDGPPSDGDCDGTYIVMLGAVLDDSNAAQLQAQVRADHPDAKMLKSSNDCYRFATSGATSMYLGPFGSLQEACDVRFQVPVGGRYVDAYLKRGGLDSGATSISCLCPYRAADLPKLAMDDSIGLNGGPYVAELQGALSRLDTYDRDVNDGDFESLTDEAVRHLQRASGLEDDGIVGVSTWDAVLDADC